MSVIVVGLEQHDAPLELLERVAVPEAALGKTLASLRDRPNLSEVVVLSTCLRTELYAVVERFHDGVADLQEFLATTAGTTLEAMVERLTVLFDDAVSEHLFEVAAGLRSSVLGESEVLGQVRRAVEHAEAERAAGPVLSGLFRRAVQAGRRVRAETAIAQGATSLSHVAVELAAARLGGSLGARRVVVVGAGDMAVGVVDAVRKRAPAPEIVVANRTAARAEALAARAGATAVGLAQLPAVLADADAVLASTSSELPLLGPEHFLDTARARVEQRRAALVALDLGVPRNVDPSVRDLAGVDLLDMQDINAHAERALAGRRAELGRAEEIVVQEVERYRADERARGATPVVQALRNRLDDLRRTELQRHRARLPAVDDEQWREVDAVVRDVLAKVLHRPTVVLKDTAGTSRGERLVEAIRALFDL